MDIVTKNCKTENKKVSELNYKILVITIFFGFLIFGFSENIKGPAIPRFQSDFNLNELNLGLLLALNSLGYLLACSFTGLLSRKIGLKNTNILCFVIMASSGLMIYLSQNYVIFSGSYFLLYIGNGMLEISLGIMAARTFTKNTGTMLNLSHFFYGLSSMIAPIMATWLMGTSFGGKLLGWRGMYLVVLSLSLIPIIPALLSRFPEDTLDESDRSSFKEYLHDPIAWLIVFTLSFGVVCEMAVGGWLVNYLEKVHGFSTKSASAVLTSFFLFFMLARFFLGPLTDKLGFVKSLIIFSGFAGTAIVIGVLLGKPGVFLLSFSGIGIAPIYPTIMALLSKVYQRNIDTAMTFTVTLMGIALVVGNFLVGAVTDMFTYIFTSAFGSETGVYLGYSAGFIFIGACCLICFGGLILLYKMMKKQNRIF